MATLQLLVVSGPDKDRRLDLQEGTGLMLGRHPDAAYRLTDPRVSRFHCEIRLAGDQVTVIDNNGAGGVFVNRAKVSQHRLQPGDVVQIGDTLLCLEVGDAGLASTVSGLGAPAELDSRATEQLIELSGRTLAHFQIGPVLGKGVSSLVFRATDTEDGQAVALKVMHPSFSKDEDEMQRFVRAMKTMLPLRHPNLVTVCGAGKSGPYCWVAMELVEGESLTQVIQRIGVAGMLDWKYAYRVAMHIGRALEYAHGQNIIHRNIAPANILVQSSDKTAKLGDLMLAKALEGTLAQQITKPGELVGDVNYMSPERTRSNAADVDGRSDLFSLGATVYALLTGKPPFAGQTLVETITKVRNAEPVKPTKAQMAIPALFEGVVLRLLAKRPEERYPTATELLAELERVGRYSGVTV